MLRYAFLAVFLVLAMGCGRESALNKTGIALVQLPSGRLITETCLKTALDTDANPETCRAVTQPSSTYAVTDGARGTHSYCTSGCGSKWNKDNWNQGYSSPYYSSYYYVINPWNYSRQSFCSGYTNSFGCYNYLYPNYDRDINIYVNYQSQRPSSCSYSYGAFYGGYSNCWQSYWWY